MLFDSDDFALLGLPRRQALDRAELDARRRAVLAEVHPDRFASAGGAQQRMAMQWAVRVNEAYERLKDPLRRAAYLCTLGGVAVAAEDNTAMPAAFLMEQIAWHEALEDASARDAVEAIAARLKNQHEVASCELTRTIDERADYTSAAQQVRALMFFARLGDDVARRIASLPA